MLQNVMCRAFHPNNRTLTIQAQPMRTSSITHTHHSQPEEAQNVEICKANPDYYNGDTKAWTGTATDFSTDLLNAIKQANECVGYLEQGKACDRQRSQFEVDFRMYAQEFRDTCNDHSACYTKAVADRGVIFEDVTKLEAAQKMVWISPQKIYCYANKLSALEQSGVAPTSADIVTCTALDPSTDPSCSRSERRL